MVTTHLASDHVVARIGEDLVDSLTGRDVETIALQIEDAVRAGQPTFHRVFTRAEGPAPAGPRRDAP